MKPSAPRIRPDSMFLNPAALLMLVVLVGVTGWVCKSLLISWHRLNKEDGKSSRLDEMEERLRKVESATTSILVDVTSMREKQRFMAKLQAGSPSRETVPAAPRGENDISPLDTQSIPIIPRARSPRY